jgi:hypothetical protein
MAEIRINATGELKLYDSDDSNYVSFKSAGTVSSDVAWVLPSADGSNGQVLTTDGSSTLSWATASSADPSSADGDTLGTASAEWSDLYLADGGVVYFGNDQEIKLTHVADTGLTLKHTATADDKPVSLTLQTGETDIAVSDVIGAINFQAPDEGTGTDAILVAAGIEAVSEGDFSSSNNATKLSFKTAASEAAAEKMSLSSTGVLTTSGDIVAASGSVRNRPNANPLIINGSMAVAQRATSTASITSSGYHTVDRWRFNYSGSAGTWTQSQEALGTSDQATTGQKIALKMDCTSTSSLGSGGYMSIQQVFEGQDLQLIKKGTSAAEKVTFSFWVKATKTGTNIMTMRDNDNTRNCSIAYTISSSDTWEKKIVNFPADTTGAFGDDNNASLYVNWYLGAGTDLQSGTLATTWAAYDDQHEAVGQVDNGDNTSNNFHLTGVQLEVGEYTSSTIPPFQHESFADNLRRCARYYCEWGGSNGSNYTVSYNVAAEANGTSAVVNAGFFTPVPLRADPSINNPTMGYFDYNTVTSDTSGGTVSIKGGEGHMNLVSVSFTGCSSLSDATSVTARARGTLTMDAEL